MGCDDLLELSGEFELSNEDTAPRCFKRLPIEAAPEELARARIDSAILCEVESVTLRSNVASPETGA